ncbi:unnamed protein product [Nesidiocoris tenuis]|uniref:Chromatin-remodeling ATPase INO80 n=1 Tax=Nesidiocoris tenuis TaxID=355587 RepID=A0A6H5FYX3_9HEMI|nr:unnamed protein product [Nesidiocoris tenuis]
MVVKTEIAKPLHIQLLEKNLNLDNFLNEVEHYLKQPDNDDDDLFSDSDAELSGVDLHTSESVWNATATTKQDRISDKLRLYNLTSVGNDRQWLQQVLLSDTSESSGEEITEDDLKQMLKLHVLKRKYRKKFYKDPKNRQYQYYSTGLLSNFDKFPEHQLATTGGCKKRKVNGGKKEKHRGTESQDDGSGEDSKRGIKEEFDDELRITSRRKSGSHKKKAPSQAKTIEVLTHRRRKMWANMAKKEIGKVQRCRANNHKEMLTSCKRVATYCVRHWRQKALQSQRNMKETLWRAKRLTREMQMYWKRYERVERETRRRMEKEAEEQRKLDVELMEAKRQQRKLNFLITQTELYAHFMSRKLGEKSAEEQLRILNQLEEEVNPRLSCIDDYDCEAEKERVRMRVEFAFKTEEERTREFGCAPRFAPNFGLEKDLPQPNIFRGSLKGYQIKGMTWLANLYDQGINGILADEMGLGKTVQSIAFLCHIAEKYSVWGPFLIISPASTLHNWQQEMQRFVPDFKVVPYWGNQQERKILRQFWDLKGIHTKEASFHVVITSYQLVISDIKYFNRIKWQYLILDEAQAIKSTTRWLHIFSNMNRFRQPDEFSVLLQPAKISKQLQFTSATGRVYTHTSVNIHSIPETLEHRILRSRKVAISAGPEPFQLLPEFPHVPRKPKVFECVPVELPRFLNSSILKVEVCKSKDMYSHSRAWAWKIDRHKKCDGVEGSKTVWYGSPELSELLTTSSRLHPIAPGGLLSCRPIHGWSNIIVPDKQTLVTDAGKLTVLDSLLTRLKQQGHRALIYSQMTRMIDLLEEYMWFRKHTYMRLDGSSKISDRRDMVADFQNRADIFVFLLSTRAGGLGINLTAADTVIFYDSDWNPTVDQQAMDRAHRLGQTKQVTVYRLICKGTIEERILQRAQEKSEIQRMVISGGNFKPDTLKPKEVVSLLLDDAEIEEKYRQKQAERKLQEENKLDLKERERKRKNAALSSYKDSVKQIKTEDGGIVEVYQGVGMTTSSIPGSPPLEMSPVLQHGESFGSSIKSEPLGTPKRPMAGERVKAKRGRPPRSTLRGGLSRPSVTSMPPIVTSDKSN